MSPLLELTGVSRTFAGESNAGIRDVTLSVEQGEFLAIVGPSGAGKSTLLNILGLLDGGFDGSYAVGGVDVKSLTERELTTLRATSIGFVFQSSYVLPHVSAVHNAALGLRTNRVPLLRRSALARRALDSLGLLSRSGTEARLLSGGERQRVAIARAVAHRPPLILADEPTGNLDRVSGTEVLRYLKELNRRGATVILITHDPAIADLADRRVQVVDGRTHEIPTTHDLLSRGSAPFARSDDRGMATSNRTSSADDIADALGSITRRPLRSALLALAFMLGVAGLVSAIGVSETATAQVSSRLAVAALDQVAILPPPGPDYLAEDSGLLDEWMAQLDALEHVESAGFVITAPESVAHVRRLSPEDPPPSEEYFVLAASSSYLHLNAVTGSGAPLSLLDEPRIHASAWVGADVFAGLGLASPGPGSTLWVNGKRVSVVGTLENGIRLPGVSRTIVVTRDVLADAPDLQHLLVLRTEPGFPASVAEAAPLVLDPSNPGAFTTQTVADLRELRFGVATDLSALIAMLSAVLLALAIVSAGATMYLSVQARTHEIGLRRAIGASRADVARLFLIEGAAIGLSGGAVGALIGTLATLILSLSRGWDPLLPGYLVPFAITMGFATGLASSIVPAAAAARLDPATALRT